MAIEEWHYERENVAVEPDHNSQNWYYCREFGYYYYYRHSIEHSSGRASGVAACLAVAVGEIAGREVGWLNQQAGSIAGSLDCAA